jgi:hypothetical protein
MPSPPTARLVPQWTFRNMLERPLLLKQVLRFAALACASPALC